MPEPITAITAGLTAAGGIGSTLIGKSSSDKAADAQKDASKRAANVQMQMYNQTRSDLQPYAQAGLPAMRSVLAMYGLTPGSKAYNEKAMQDFKAAPDYQIAMREGVDALDNSAAARGMLKSGAAIKGVMEYGSDLGTRKLDSYLSRLMQIAGGGQSAAAGQGAAAMSTGRSLADTYLGQGEAEASGIIGGGNALSGGISNLTNNALYALNRNPSAYGRTPSIY
jgi:hypothetical protein